MSIHNISNIIRNTTNARQASKISVENMIFYFFFYKVQGLIFVKNYLTWTKFILDLYFLGKIFVCAILTTYKNPIGSKSGETENFFVSHVQFGDITLSKSLDLNQNLKLTSVCLENMCNCRRNNELKVDNDERTEWRNWVTL